MLSASSWLPLEHLTFSISIDSVFGSQSNSSLDTQDTVCFSFYFCELTSLVSSRNLLGLRQIRVCPAGRFRDVTVCSFTDSLTSSLWWCQLGFCISLNICSAKSIITELEISDLSKFEKNNFIEDTIAIVFTLKNN